MIKKIISGGQTGADFGGLEAAVELGLSTGGWCPKGWKTEKGPNIMLKVLGLRETTSPEYGPRTIMNVSDSDGTVIFGNLHSSGSTLTIRTCADLRKPYLPNPDEGELRDWIEENGISVLNVAGNRESRKPGIQNAVKRYLVRELGPHADQRPSSGAPEDH